PDAGIRARLEAFVLARDGGRAAAGAAVEAAERARPALPGTLEERAFADFRDLDDITAGVFEVLTHTGKYYWVPMSRVERIEFTPPSRPLDLLWRTARMVVRDAFDAEVHLPAVYGTAADLDDGLRLGRRTDWLGADGEAVVGVGRRTFVIDGEEPVDMLAIGTLTFAAGGAL
ncbi:MAG: SciE type virulence protein, partial [Planctomycetia bacterium]|nr:SciE type virulence protein [Planctomycetia bacterium]